MKNWIKKDKIKHLAAGAFVGLFVALIVGVSWGIFAAVAAGVAKEAWDRFGGRGVADVRDVIFTTVGGFIGAVVVLMLSGCGGEASSGVTTTFQDSNMTIKNNVTVDAGDTNVSVDNNISVTVVVTMDDHPALGSGTFEDPYQLRQAVYAGLPRGNAWFIADVHNANCTITSVSSVAVTHAIAYDGDLNIIYRAGWTGAYWPLAIDINDSDMVLIGIDYEDDNATTLFTGDCLDRPVFYRSVE